MIQDNLILLKTITYIMVQNLARKIEKQIVRSLEAFPAVYLAGPRQSGKTTLVQHISKCYHQAHYITFDDMQQRMAVQSDPMGFLGALGGPVILDEIQMAPELFRPLKIFIDKNRSLPDGGKGRFLLTGSASLEVLPQLSDALVGRMIVHHLLPLSAAEWYGSSSLTFIDRAFDGNWESMRVEKDLSSEWLEKASYPEIGGLEMVELRSEWCRSYVSTILQRDVRFIHDIEKSMVMLDIMKLVAAHPGRLQNDASLASDLGVSHLTLKKYRHLLEGLFLVSHIPAWTKHRGKRLIKSPKLYLSDINILAYLMGGSINDLKINNIAHWGRVLENAVAIELLKQLTFSVCKARLYHYRRAAGQEIDFLIEYPNQKVVALEVKSKKTVEIKDFHQMRLFKDDNLDIFLRGVVLYQGDQVVPFGNDLWAIPVSMLWSA